MKSLWLRVLLNLYFCFQCLATVINFILFLGVIICVFMMYGLGAESINTFMEAIPILTFALLLILFFQFYVLITPIAANATLKFNKQQPLTKFQKLSAIAFPIITVPLYIVLIWYLLK